MGIISAYFYIIKTRILTSLAYRFDVFSRLVANFILIISVTFFWKVAYNGLGTVDGVNERQMVIYSIMSTLLGAAFVFDVENTVNRRIREGDVAVDFIKPASLFGIYLAQDIGSIASSAVLNVFPLLLVSSVFIAVPLPSSFGSFLLFLLSCMISYLILWLLSAIVGMSSFWVVELGPIGHVKGVMVRTLSGSIIPIWFFPDAIKNVLNYLPFVYTYQIPLGIYVGKSDLESSLKGMLVQAVWALIMFVLFLTMQRKARGRVFVQGG